MKPLRPFWRYYGGKWAAARKYDPPRFGTLVEPFAGAAGYSLHYADHDVILIERNPVIASIWRWLIAATPEDVLAVGDIPDGGTVDDIDAPQPARWLAGFWCNNAVVQPRKRPSKWASRGEHCHNWGGWNQRSRSRIAQQVGAIKHWTLIESDYRQAPNISATWFVDPPYQGRAGRYYPTQPDDFVALGDWCRTRRGQVMVCEQAGADWLPFAPFASLRSASGRHRPSRSSEVIWTNGGSAQGGLFGP